MAQAFLDKSSLGLLLLPMGNAYRDTTTYRTGGGSMRVASSGSIAGLDSRLYALDSSDFTLEAWVYPLSYPGVQSPRFSIVSARSIGLGLSNFDFGLYQPSSDNYETQFIAYNNNSQVVVCTCAGAPLNQWSHVAIERYGSSFTCYLNGVGGTSVTYAGALVPVDFTERLRLAVGSSTALESEYWTGRSFNGPIDSVRFTIGEARYKGNFTPDTGAFPVGGADSLWDKVRLLLDGTMGQHNSVFIEPIPKVLALVPPLPTSARYANQLIAPRNMQHGGNGVIYGTVANKGTPNAPVYRRVRLFRDKDGICIREMWSDPVTGAYSFSNVDPLERYTVLSYDHTGNYRAVVGDNLTPEIMA